MAILAELRDPRVRDVTVTYVEVSDDLRHAKVHVSVMGDQTRQDLSLRGLQNAAGFLQSKIADSVELRYTPRLVFVLDQGVKRSIEVAQILKRVLPSQPPPETAADAAAEPDDEAAEPDDEAPAGEEDAGREEEPGAEDEPEGGRRQDKALDDEPPGPD